MALTDKLTTIANAIREKTGSTETMTLDAMATEISNIQTGGSEKTEPYIEETYDSRGNLIGAKLVGQSFIRDGMFYQSFKLANVSIPSDITKIGQYSFDSCSSLTSIDLPSTITLIASNAFNGCSKLTLTSLPRSLRAIGSSAFYNCKLLALTSLPSEITSIGSFAF